MTAIEDHCDTIRAWLNVGSVEFPNSLVTSWTRMAEELLSTDLRCKHMITTVQETVASGAITIPDDWQEFDFVRVVGGKPLHYRTRDDFYSNEYDDPNYNSGHYTIRGLNLIVGALADGTVIEFDYFQKIPPLTDPANWLQTYYSRIYVSATIAVSKMYTIGEEQEAVVWDAATQDFINKVNDEYRMTKASGSRLNMPRRKGFG